MTFKTLIYAPVGVEMPVFNAYGEVEHWVPALLLVLPDDFLFISLISVAREEETLEDDEDFDDEDFDDEDFDDEDFDDEDFDDEDFDDEDFDDEDEEFDDDEFDDEVFDDEDDAPSSRY
jgi:hypothetical protein